jgi:hypothetical protein
MVVDCKGLALIVSFLLSLRDYVDSSLHGYCDLSDIGRYLELDLVLFLIVEFYILIALANSNVVDLIDCLQGHLSVLEESQIRELPLVENEAWLNQNLSPKDCVKAGRHTSFP